jgi:hypothetical protein
MIDYMNHQCSKEQKKSLIYHSKAITQVRTAMKKRLHLPGDTEKKHPMTVDDTDKKRPAIVDYTNNKQASKPSTWELSPCKGG